MATFKTTIKSQQDTADSSLHSRPNALDFQRRIFGSRVSYTCAGTEAAVTLAAGATTSGSTTCTCTSTTGLVAGMAITGTGIPLHATIASVTNSTTFELSVAATATGSSLTFTCGDILDIVFPRVKNARIVPELSRVSNPTTGTGCIIAVKLQKVITDPVTGAITSAVDLSAVADVSDNSVALARVTGGDIPLIAHEDYVRVLLTKTASTTFTMTAGQVIDFDLVYQARDVG